MVFAGDVVYKSISVSYAIFFHQILPLLTFIKAPWSLFRKATIATGIQYIKSDSQARMATTESAYETLLGVK